MYQRKELTAAFTVKKIFSDDGGEALAFIHSKGSDTIDTIHDMIYQQVSLCRSEKKDQSTSAMDSIQKLPVFLLKLVGAAARFLDRHGWMPQPVIATDPFYASAVLSNLGSIGLPGGYHHLVNWGTNSCFIVVGKKYMKMEYDKDGNEDLHEVIPLGITLDERIADGYYYSGTVALVKELLEHPELLELPADTPVEFAIRR